MYACCDVLESEQLPWSSWSKHEPELQDRVGLYRPDFDRVYSMCEQYLIDRRVHQRIKDQQHTHISTHNMLTLILYWLHKAPSFHSLSKQFPSYSIITIERTIYAVIDILYEQLVPVLIQLISADAPSSRFPSLEHVRIVIDSTFIPLPAAEKRPKYYHPKSPTKSALKVEIDSDLTHRIVCVSDAVNGAMHDMRLIRQSGILNQMNDQTRAIGDKGYIGQLGIITPKRKKQRVSTEAAQLQTEKQRRHELESERAAVETINKRFKQWHIVGRGWNQEYEDRTLINKVVRVISALANLTLDDHPIRFERRPLRGR